MIKETKNITRLIVESWYIYWFNWDQKASLLETTSTSVYKKFNECKNEARLEISPEFYFVLQSLEFYKYHVRKRSKKIKKKFYFCFGCRCIRLATFASL